MRASARRVRGWGHWVIGFSQRVRGRDDKAVVHATKSMRDADLTGDPQMKAWSHMLLCLVYGFRWQHQESHQKHTHKNKPTTTTRCI